MRDRKIEFGNIKAMLTWSKEQAVNIFLPSIFLSFECFCGMLLPSRPKQTAEAKTEK
jgi:hypothetical protein